MEKCIRNARNDYTIPNEEPDEAYWEEKIFGDDTGDEPPYRPPLSEQMNIEQGPQELGQVMRGSS